MLLKHENKINNKRGNAIKVFTRVMCALLLNLQRTYQQQSLMDHTTEQLYRFSTCFLLAVKYISKY